MNEQENSIGQVVKSLTARLGSAKVLVAGLDYDEARRVWNAAITSRPAVIVRCETAGDVQLAVKAATNYHVPLSVRGGGHDWAGRAIRDGRLVIDLTPLRQVAVEHGVALVAGGATSTAVVIAAQPYGLVAVTGTNGPISLAGLSLAGGYGPLSGRFGLALDNMLEAEVVLADGQLVTADETQEPDLFWALRGGGGEFWGGYQPARATASVA